MIDRKYLFFKTKKSFEDIRNQISSDAIVFIKGETQADRAIWTHGVFYSPNTGLEHSKGFFESVDALKQLYPWPSAGDWAIIATDEPDWVLGGQFPITFCRPEGQWYICSCEIDGQWIVTDRKYGYEHIELTQYLKRDEINLEEFLKKGDINLDDYYTKSEASELFVSAGQLNRKQDRLISGTSIKTINGESILGSGNISVVKNSDLADYVKTSEIGKYITGQGGTIIDTSVFATKNELNDYVQQNNLKTINGVSLVGGGNLQIDTNAEVISQIQEDIQNIKDSLNASTTWHFGETLPIILDKSENDGLPDIPGQDVFREDIEQLQDEIQQINNKINNINVPDFVFLTQAEYDQLESYGNNTLYYIIENTKWTFPITLT